MYNEQQIAQLESHLLAVASERLDSMFSERLATLEALTERIEQAEAIVAVMDRIEAKIEALNASLTERLEDAENGIPDMASAAPGRELTTMEARAIGVLIE